MTPDLYRECVADEAYVTYRISFASPQTADAATGRLLKAGFAVNEVGRGQGVTLEAGMVGEETRVDETLNKALAGIDHEPEIPWHAARFTGFFDPRP